MQSFRYQGCSLRKIFNILYTMFIFLLIIFSYASSIIACQARLEISPEVQFKGTNSSNAFATMFKKENSLY